MSIHQKPAGSCCHKAIGSSDWWVVTKNCNRPRRVHNRGLHTIGVVWIDDIVSYDPGERNLHCAPVDLVIVRRHGAAEDRNCGNRVDLIVVDGPDFRPTPCCVTATTGGQIAGNRSAG